MWVGFPWPFWLGSKPGAPTFGCGGGNWLPEGLLLSAMVNEVRNVLDRRV